MRLFRLVLLPLLAAADVTLRYAADEAGELAMVIEADDAGNIRAERGNGQAMIIRENEIFLVLPFEGRPVVRFEDALALAAEARGDATPTARERNRLVDRGAQRVGQWEGRLYWIEPLPPAGDRLRSEIVIATDPALVPAGRLFARVEEEEARMFRAAFAVPPSDYLELSRGLFDRGLMLRIAGRYRLEGLSDAPVPAERFALPGPVLSRDAYRELLGR